MELNNGQIDGLHMRWWFPFRTSILQDNQLMYREAFT